MYLFCFNSCIRYTFLTQVPPYSIGTGTALPVRYGTDDSDRFARQSENLAYVICELLCGSLVHTFGFLYQRFAPQYPVGVVNVLRMHLALDRKHTDFQEVGCPFLFRSGLV